MLNNSNPKPRKIIVCDGNIFSIVNGTMPVPSERDLSYRADHIYSWAFLLARVKFIVAAKWSIFRCSRWLRGALLIGEGERPSMLNDTGQLSFGMIAAMSRDLPSQSPVNTIHKFSDIVLPHPIWLLKLTKQVWWASWFGLWRMVRIWVWQSYVENRTNLSVCQFWLARI